MQRILDNFICGLVNATCYIKKYLLQQQQAAEEQLARKSMSEEEFKQHQKMKRLEAEAQEEVRQTLARQREAKIKAMKAAEPQKPKEITVNSIVHSSSHL